MSSKRTTAPPKKSQAFGEVFGPVLRQRREGARLTIEKLAALSDLDAADIKQWEKGQGEVTLLDLLSLAKGLGVGDRTLRTLLRQIRTLIVRTESRMYPKRKRP